MTNTTMKLLFAGAFTLTLGWGAASYAFPFAKSWHESSSGEAGVNRAGAGGIYGTGGKQDYGIKCSHCHVDGAGTIDMNVVVTREGSGSPTGWENVGGLDGYSPGTRYTITVELANEHLIDNADPDLNGMAATFETQAGALAGTLYSDSGQNSASCPGSLPFTDPPAGKTTMLYGDCHAALFVQRPRDTAWTFDWVAPSAGAGELTLYVVVVDGDHYGRSSLDDDTVERTFALVEGP